jgi:hypothetical protein
MKDQSRVVFRLEETEPFDVDEFRKTAEFHVPHSITSQVRKRSRNEVSSLAKNGSSRDGYRLKQMSNKETSFRVSNKRGHSSQNNCSSWRSI